MLKTYPILSPGCVHIQHELISITRELTNISAARLNFIADNIPEYVLYVLFLLPRD